MPMIRIDIERVEDLARQIKYEREGTVETLLAKLRGVNDELNAAWDGPAQDQFSTVYGDWIYKLQNYSETLNSIYAYLMNVTDAFRAADQAARSAAEGFGPSSAPGLDVLPG
jgi:WXG100 family type VII secretion target